MAEVLVPEVLSNGSFDNLPAGRPRRLARWLGGESTALQRLDQQKVLEIAKVQAKAEVIKATMREATELEHEEYQLQRSVEVSKHKIDLKTTTEKFRADLKAKRERLRIKLEEDFVLDCEVEDFINELEEMGLPPLQEAQHRMKARKTARRERERQRRHYHNHR